MIKPVWIDDYTLNIQTPPMRRGVADVEVLSASGLSDIRVGALLYVDWNNFNGDKRNTAGQNNCGCTTAPSTGWAVWLLLLPVFGIRRRP